MSLWPQKNQEKKHLYAGLGLIVALCVVLTGLWTNQANATGPAAPSVFTTPSAPISPSASLPVTTVPPTTTTTVAPVPPPPPPPPTTVPPPPPAPAPGFGCAAALAYLAAHSAPGFAASCPGPDDGHQATTTAYFANGTVTGTIGIEVPCPAAYMNEAHNSWVLRARYMGTPIPDGLGTVIDPYGYCH